MCFQERIGSRRECDPATQTASVTQGRFRASSPAARVSSRPCHLGTYSPSPPEPGCRGCASCSLNPDESRWGEGGGQQNRGAWPLPAGGLRAPWAGCRLRALEAEGGEAHLKDWMSLEVAAVAAGRVVAIRAAAV